MTIKKPGGRSTSGRKKGAEPSPAPPRRSPSGAIPLSYTPESPDASATFEAAFVAAGREIRKAERETDFASERRGRLAVAKSLRQSAVKLLDLRQQSDHAAQLLIIAGKLEDEARALPDPREALTLRLLAQAFVELHRLMGHRVRLTDEGDDVQRFERMCLRIGMVLSTERFRGALAEAARVGVVAPAAQHVVDIVAFAMLAASGRQEAREG